VDEEFFRRLDEALICLPEPMRETFLLAYKERLPYAEIASRQNITEKSVIARLHRAHYLLGK
jgi:RNA polymerase sigma factor (sigma-70 family)